ncbi:Dipeptidase [Lactobacillus selangorensis]|uniref:Dipeptidase n=1 Tax=Lactobacillus selangorensis TaxID=81857 RepID=A0A0R2FIA9_9LACO|nr:C69 family dipeptidase [Lactobacillus selangorensis]KRN28393.1 Dipeptidase [Lactobacillus selangorensis]KRN31894.1 Dipeptidase [Lactobacillus selangorensis]
MKSAHSSCTTVLVGKKASLHHSTMIARNEDFGAAVNPKRFVVIPAHAKAQHYRSKGNDFQIDLPENALRYTATPDADPQYGDFAEDGINSENVAMSASESAFSNRRVLAVDPLVANGIAEDAMVSVVLPFIHSAKEGVERLGAIIEKYGTAETNGVAFSDADEVWYLETAGGHHWAAQRIPDGQYAVVANQLSIQEIDFNKPDDFLTATDLKKFVKKNHLNPAKKGFNFRQIFGTHDESDRHYNTPRVWYGHNLFSPAEPENDPFSEQMAFTRTPDQKLGADDVKTVLSSHYQDTPYDPYGHGTAVQKKQFRPIGLDRNQEMHVLEIRSDLPAEFAAIHWLALGVNVYNTMVPFYANCEDTPDNYRNTTAHVNINNMYWLNRTIGVLAEAHYAASQTLITDYQQDTFETLSRSIQQTDLAVTKVAKKEVTGFLTAQNAQTASAATQKTRALFADLVRLANNHMTLHFNGNEDL